MIMAAVCCCYQHLFLVAHPAAMALSKKLSLDSIDGSSLARLWEESFHLRERLRVWEDERGNRRGGRMICWPNPENKVICMPAIAMNIYVLRMLARWWCPQTNVAKSPSVQVLKKQALSWVNFPTEQNPYQHRLTLILNLLEANANHLTNNGLNHWNYIV